MQAFMNPMPPLQPRVWSAVSDDALRTALPALEMVTEDASTVLTPEAAKRLQKSARELFEVALARFAERNVNIDLLQLVIKE